MVAACLVAFTCLAAATASAQPVDAVSPPAREHAGGSEPGREPSGPEAPSTAHPPDASNPSSTAASAPSLAVSPIVSPPVVAWSVPEGCPDASTVDGRARSLANVDSVHWVRAGSVRGRIVREADEWVLSLQIERARGLQVPARGEGAPGSVPASPARVFRAPDCAELGEAAAIAIALALGGADSAPSPDRAENAAPAGNERGRDEGGAALAGEVRSVGATAHAEAMVDTASLGGLALGAAGELGVRWRAIGLRAYGLGLPSRRVHLAPSQFVELSLWAAGLRGCYRVAAGLLLVDGCGGAELGAFGAAGRGLADARERRDVWGAATLGTWLGVGLSEHLLAGARVEAAFPLSRERYLVNGDELVHAMSAPSVRLALSLGGTLGAN